MKSHNQGGLFQLELVSIVKLEGELAPDEVVLRVRNLSVEPTVFENAVKEAFPDGIVEILKTHMKVTLEANAERLHDGEHDLSDTEAWLRDMAQRILDKLIKVPGWGDDEQLDHQLPYDLLD